MSNLSFKLDPKDKRFQQEGANANKSNNIKINNDSFKERDGPLNQSSILIHPHTFSMFMSLIFFFDSNLNSPTFN